MDWELFADIAYVVVIIVASLHIIYNVRSNEKALAYVLLTILLPFIGIAVYLAFGLNYRQNKLYSKKIIRDKRILDELQERITIESEKAWNTQDPEIQKHKKLALYLLNDGMSPLSGNNKVELLINGEEKFPALLDALQNARHHIHIQYYIFENGDIAERIKDILVQKAKEGVQVRFMYDDFGSRSIRKRFVRELKDGGVEAYPFYKIHFILLANRVNFRNHRKIVVIDGCVGFTGGINISDRYTNDPPEPGKLYWRDTHVKITGPGVYYLQYLFICDWNFCSGKALTLHPAYFCTQPAFNGSATVQVASSGPDSDLPTLMYSIGQVIGLAEKELLITTPYFIPGQNIMGALHIAALSGVKIKLLVPFKSDSAVINTAARANYAELLAAGVEIYQYTKGFMHAKTIVSDGQLAIVGTANMDHRSFEMNFEVNCMIYDDNTAKKLRDVFYEDLRSAELIDPDTWNRRPWFKKFAEKFVSLFSPLL
ncbi:MAG: cardiolipin synthase [Bacteroidetes bacterium]|nr:cardiolipin synthase [Bacteroidota bacterium]